MRIWYMNLIMKLMSLVQNSTYLLKTYPVKFVSTIIVTGLCWKIFPILKVVSTKKVTTFFVCADNHQLSYCIPWSWDGLWLNTYKNVLSLKIAFSELLNVSFSEQNICFFFSFFVSAWCPFRWIFYQPKLALQTFWLYRLIQLSKTSKLGWIYLIQIIG